MSTRKPNTAVLLTALLLGLSAAISNAKTTIWPSHVTQAQTYVNQIKANNNSFNSPAFLGYDASKTLRAQTKCSTFVTLLLKNTYPEVVTDQALIALTSSSSPYADEWFAAIAARDADPKSGLAFKGRPTVASMKVGDIIASSYTTSGNTGHTMILASLSLAEANIVPPYPIPDVATVNRYLVKVYDSTKNLHWSDFASGTPDSRYNKQWNGTNWVGDEGIGSGYIALYEDTATGKPVAGPGHPSRPTYTFYYAVPPPADSAADYRPLAIGYLTGPGL